MKRRLRGTGVVALALASLLVVGMPAPAQTAADNAAAVSGGPIRIRQPAQEAPGGSVPASSASAAGDDIGADAAAAVPRDVARRTTAPRSVDDIARGRAAAPQSGLPKAGEFEAYAGLPRFGADLVNELAEGAVDFSPVVPPDYVVQVGDEVLVTIWGSIDADLRLVVDRAGRVNIPRVGPVPIAGRRYAELRDAIARQVARTFKNFDLSASLGRLRGVRVYVTGFVRRPGAYSVSGLSSVLNAVMRAGGPAAAGSFRRIELRRGGRAVAQLDLYDLLLSGDRSGDRVVEPDDVIHVAAVGPQVAVKGSVNEQAVFELKSGETVADLLRMAGGFSSVADRSRVAIERLDERNAQRITQLALPASNGVRLADGDVLWAFSAVEAALSVQRQNKRVRVDGEVVTPGEYVLRPDSTVRDALRAAGGLTPSAFLFGAQFTRTSVLLTQQENYDRALRDLETDLARTTSAQRVSNTEEAATAAARNTANARLIERLRALRPTGRVVLNMTPEATELPDLALEDGDRLYVPAKPSTVGVFGSVFNTGTYLWRDGRVLDEYVSLAGGPTKGADSGSVFVVRANGQVASSRQQGSWYSREARFGRLPALPGDTIFVPEEMDRTTFIQNVKDWTQVLYQFGLGAAGISTIIK